MKFTATDSVGKESQEKTFKPIIKLIALVIPNEKPWQAIERHQNKFILET